MLPHYREIKTLQTTPVPRTLGAATGIPRRPQLKVAEFKAVPPLNPGLIPPKVRLWHHATRRRQVGGPQSPADGACPAVAIHQMNVLVPINASFVIIGLTHGTIVQNDLGTSTGIIVLSIWDL